MTPSAAALISTAATVAAIHTLIGVDHYLPFIALGKGSGWSLRKTLFWTTICGIGHVASSVVIAVGAGALGWALGSIQVVDAIRGDAAAYLLLAFGIGYVIWGLRHTHTHAHVHDDGSVHTHAHTHGAKEETHLLVEASPVDAPKSTPHTHGHIPTSDGTNTDPATKRHQVTIWALFVIFVLGPCEPLIPLLVAPALTHDMTTAFIVVGLFGAITIGMMLLMVTLGFFGLGLLKLKALERWAHPLAGAAVAISGGLILLGL